LPLSFISRAFGALFWLLRQNYDVQKSAGVF
jgi:hypothetical protein